MDNVIDINGQRNAQLAIDQLNKEITKFTGDAERREERERESGRPYAV